MKRIFEKLMYMEMIVILLFNSSLLTIFSIAIDQIESMTSNNNVQFSAYFFDEVGNKVTEISEGINKEGLKLYVEASVKKEGYIEDFQINLNKANFKFKEIQNNKDILKVEENQILLNRINAGENKVIELNIEAIKEEKFNIDFLTQISEIEFKCNYHNSKENSAISSKRNVIWNLKNLYEINGKINIEQNVITNTIEKYKETEKRIIQSEIKYSINENYFPIKMNEVKISVPKINDKFPEEVIVNSIKSEIANNKNITKDDYSYNKEKGELYIIKENIEENGIINWIQNAEEQFIITFIYEKSDINTVREGDIKNTIIFYDNKNAESDFKFTFDNENRNSIVTTSIMNHEDSIYKGKLYTDNERKFFEDIYINVNCEDIIENIEVNEKENKNVYTNEIKFNKQDFIELFGEEGTLNIENNLNQEIAKIDSQTGTDENNNIVINCNNATYVKIITSKPIKFGRLKIESTKILQIEDKEEIKRISAINYEVNGKYKSQLGEVGLKNEAVKINLQETISKINVELSNYKFNTIKLNEVEIDITLNENDEKYDLYKNPEIILEFPQQVTDVKIQNISKIFADNFNIDTYDIVENNGKKAIKLKLSGEDVKYTTGIIDGPMIKLNIQIEIDKLAKDSKEQLIVKYTNEKASQYNNGQQKGNEIKEIEIKSSTGMIITNEIKELDVNTIGKEDAKEVIMNVAEESKNINVNKKIINNTGENVDNVIVIGNFATNNNVNNMNVSLASAISVEGINNAIVYYSDKDEVTSDLEDKNNNWHLENNNLNEKNYMVVINDMGENDIINIGYSENIPMNLEYNKNALEEYKVQYFNEENPIVQEVSGTPVMMLTEIGPDLSISLKAEVGGNEINNGDKVKKGEIIKYTIKVKNEGSVEANNVVIKGIIPDGTVMVEPKENYEYVDGYYDEIIEQLEFSQTETSILVDEIKEYTYEVRVNNDVNVGDNGIGRASINYDGILKESNEVIINYDEGNIIATLKKVDAAKESISSMYSIKHQLTIENFSDEKLKNIEVELVTNSNACINAIMDDKFQTIKNENIFNIEELEPHSKKIVYVWVGMNNGIEELSCQLKVSACVKVNDKMYKSNSLNYIGYNYFIDIIQTSSKENLAVKEDEEFEYKFKVTNNSEIPANGITFKDNIPNEYTITKILVNGEIYDEISKDKQIIKREIAISKSLKKGESFEVEIWVRVSKSLDSIKRKVSNFGIVELEKKELSKSNEVEVTLDYIKDNINDYIEDNDDNGNNKDNDDKTDKDDEVNKDESIIEDKYSISGMAWIDENENGQKDNQENSAESIKVMIYNVQTGETLKDANHVNIITKQDGSYIINNLNKGKYILIFDYDRNVYNLTKYKSEGVEENKNSDVIEKEINIDGENRVYGVTEVIDIDGNDINGVNIGLIKKKELNLSLQKTINKVIVQTSEESIIKEFNNVDLAKVEINSKKLNGSVVLVEYDINISNIGECDAYVKKVVDNMPGDMKFDSNLNTEWYQNEGKLYNTTFANTKLKSGESVSMKLILTKTLFVDNIGLINNTASIEEIYSENNLEEIKIVDNKDQADLIISIKTGEFIRYSLMAISIFIAGTLIVILIYKRK